MTDRTPSRSARATASAQFDHGLLGVGEKVAGDIAEAVGHAELIGEEPVAVGHGSGEHVAEAGQCHGGRRVGQGA